MVGCRLLWSSVVAVLVAASVYADEAAPSVTGGPAAAAPAVVAPPAPGLTGSAATPVPTTGPTATSSASTATAHTAATSMPQAAPAALASTTPAPTSAPPANAAAATAPASAPAASAAEQSVLEEVESLGNGEDSAATLKIPCRTTEPPIANARPLPANEDLLAHATVDAQGRYVVGSGESAHALTIIPSLQKKLTSILESYETPYAAVVALDPKTGRVLAMAEHSQVRPELRGLPVKAIFPAASVFKLITASALLDAGLTPETTECGHGGKRHLSEKLIEDSDRDKACFTMSNALAFSVNTIFAKLTIKHLTSTTLRSWAEKFRFNKKLDFPEPADVSLCAVPEDGLPFAETGAGFGDVYMSPLHAAAIASVAANRGLWREPLLFDDQAPPEPDRVMDEAHAEKLVSMMEETVTMGTARRIFRERGFRVPGAVGKTGSLADKKPFRDYSWFVGFAPKDDPKIAVAAIVVNDYYWRIRGTWLGREAMRLYLEELGKRVAAETSK